ncbi:MAG: acyltransferase 3 [Bryobacterales bacterium]|nr:acyltransferase 3 [Bryobacterales bacterium]
MPEIDGLRFIAVTSVVLYHLAVFVQAGRAGGDPADWMWRIAAHGYRGVNLFYVISGFILGLPFAAHHLQGKPPVKLKSYFLRRLTRLEPPYLLNLLICYAVLVLAPGGDWRELLPRLAASAAYVHNVWFADQSAINPVAWTLEVEVQFYCLAPLLAGIFAIRPRRWRRAGLLAVILLAGIVQLYYWDATPRPRLSILYALQFFLAGFLLADVYLVDWEEKPTPHWVWDAVAVAGWSVLFALDDAQVWIVFPLLTLTLCVAAFRGVLVNRVLRNPAVTTIGGMCYTIYLFHYVVIPPMLRVSGGFHPLAQGLFAVFVVMLVSCAYFVLVERPCMQKDWPQRAWARLTGRPTGSI